MAINRIASIAEQPDLSAAGDTIDIVGIAKGGERYFVLFNCTIASRSEALRRIGSWASNPELSFSWYDAATLSQKIRELGKPEAPR